MPLTLVLGPANSAKAGEVLGAFSAVAPRGALLVVPTGADALHYRRELAAGDSVLGSVLTFAGLAGEIARRTRLAARRLSARQRDALLADALAPIRLDALEESAASPGFRRAAGALIAELERNLVTPQRFGAALARWAEQDPRRAAYAHDVAAVYDRYARECARRGRVDADRFAWQALDALRAAPDRWGRDAVFFYGFDDLTRLQRDAVETLARAVGAPVTVSLTFEAGHRAVAARAEAVAELSALADEVVTLTAGDAHYRPASRAALHHLERALFTDAPTRIDPGPAIGLLESGGERAEVELVAAQVLELLGEGVPAEEIAVVYRTLAGVAPLVARVCDQYGIPLAADYELPVAHSPLGRALRGAARCALAPDAGAADLLAYLRVAGLLESPEVADRLEAELLRAGLSSVTAARERLGWTLGELDALGAATDPGSELLRLGRRLLAAPRRRAAAVLAADETLDVRALAALERAVAELAELGARPDGPGLLELLDTLVIEARPAPAGGEVWLAEPLQIRARRFRVVFVCGLQEGAFPVPASAEPFLSDERRRELAQCAGLRLPLHEDVLDRERYLFYATVSRATERVVLSYRSSDEEGNLAVPSPFVADVADVLDPDWPRRRARRLLADVVWPVERAPTARERARAQAGARAPLSGDGPERDRHLGELALARARHSEILSAGALERYARCPVRWFVESELQPAPLRPDADALTRGSVMHDVLEQLLTALEGPIDERTLQRAEAMLPELLERAAATGGTALGAGRPEIVRAGALAAIEADLRRYLRHEAATGDGRWRPHGLEQRFGFEDGERGGGEGEERQPSLPALELSGAEGSVRLRGLVDRIDTDGHGHALVRDYKSGAGSIAVARWRDEHNLQVAIYMLVVRELTDLDPVAGFYQPIGARDLRARGMYEAGADVGGAVYGTDARPREEFDAVLDDARERAVAVAAALRSGRLEPCPQTCSRDGCAYPAICRSQ